MTETEKLDLGLEYDFWDEGVNARKLHAIEGCVEVTDDAQNSLSLYRHLSKKKRDCGRNRIIVRTAPWR